MEWRGLELAHREIGGAVAVEVGNRDASLLAAHGRRAGGRPELPAAEAEEDIEVPVVSNDDVGPRVPIQVGDGRRPHASNASTERGVARRRREVATALVQHDAECPSIGGDQVGSTVPVHVAGSHGVGQAWTTGNHARRGRAELEHAAIDAHARRLGESRITR
jgi:hypothetical protein